MVRAGVLSCRKTAFIFFIVEVVLHIFEGANHVTELTIFLNLYQSTLLMHKLLSDY